MKKLLAALALTSALVAAQSSEFTFDPAQTKVEFTLGSLLHTVHGTFALKRGELRFDPATGVASGDLVVDATSGASGNNSRDRRMHKDVLQSDKYPSIEFHADRVEGKVMPQATSHVQLHGMFTIHGAAHEMTVPVVVQSDGGRHTATAQFEIPYVKWGMKNPSTLMLRVNDKVEITVQTVSTPAPVTAAHSN